MVSESQRFGVEMWVESLTKLESQCLKCINIVESAKADIQTLRSYFSMVEFVDDGIFIDEDTEDYGRIHTNKIIGDDIYSDKLVAKTIIPAKSESVRYAPLRFILNGQHISVDRNGTGLEECIRFTALGYLRETSFSGEEVPAISKGAVTFSKLSHLRVDKSVEFIQLLETPFMNLIHYASLVATNGVRHGSVAGKLPSTLEFGMQNLFERTTQNMTKYGSERPEPKPPDSHLNTKNLWVFPSLWTWTIAYTNSCKLAEEVALLAIV